MCDMIRFVDVYSGKCNNEAVVHIGGINEDTESFPCYLDVDCTPEFSFQ